MGLLNARDIAAQAVELGADSADHLLYVSDAGIEALGDVEDGVLDGAPAAPRR